MSGEKGKHIREAERLVRDELGGAAALLAPLLSDTANSALLRSLFAERVSHFDSEVERLIDAGDRTGALAAARLAWIVKPAPARGLALLALLRDTHAFADAKILLAELRSRFPKEPTLLIQEALLNLARGEGREAVEQLWAYMNARGTISTSDRRLIARVLRTYGRQCHASGVPTAAPHPLVEPEIALVYNQDIAGNTAQWSQSSFAARQFSDNIARHQLRSAARTASQPRQVGTPQRVLVVTAGNWHFLTNLLENWDHRHTRAFEVRTFDISALMDGLKDDLHAVFAPQSMGVSDDDMWRKIAALEPLFAELVDWSDVVFCEWAGVHALWLSRYLPASSRLIVRLHSYEVFSQWPLFMNWGGVDGVVFVAEHIRRFANIQYGLERYRWLRTPVIPNFNHLERFRTTKPAAARRTLALFGYASRNKDPLFAVQTLALLAPSDPKWNLRLFGVPWRPEGSALDANYRVEFDAYVEAHGLGEKISYHEFTDDLPAAFEDVGFVLSTSWREGTHESVLEGMASGAIPVIRRWPMTRPFGAPECVYPDLEYCDDPADAAAIIQRYAGAKAFAARSAEMNAYAMARFDIGATMPLFESFVTETVTSQRADNRL